MKTEKTLKRPITSFIVLTNLIFLPLFALTGITIMLGLPSIFFDGMLCIASWSSTFVFIILFRKIYPGKNFREYVKDKFKTKLNFPLIIVIIAIQFSICGVIMYLLSSTNNEGGTVFTISSFGMLAYLFFKNLLAGPLGEELGWRGFVLNELQTKHTPLMAALIVGFWWGIWHLPIWFTTGFMGIQLIKYIIFFMISVISISIIITAFYNLNKNLLVPILIHQLFNFLIGVINGSILSIIMYCSIVYFIVAIILIVLNPRKVLYGDKIKNLESKQVI